MPGIRIGSQTKSIIQQKPSVDGFA